MNQKHNGGSVKPNQTATLYIYYRDRELLGSRKCKFPCCDRRASGIQWRNYLPDGSRVTWLPELKQNFFASRVLGTMRRDSSHVDTAPRIPPRDHHPK